MIHRNEPFLSIVVPTRARERQLTACLGALALLEYPRERFEVIVVDDGSRVTPSALVSSFSDRMNVSLLNQENAGPAAARNHGASRAQGHYLTFTDDDCLPQPDWLQRLAARFAETPEAMIGGRTENALRENRYAVASQVLISYLYDYYNGINGRGTESGTAAFLTSNNLAVPAQVFFDMGGFESTFLTAAAEDRDLCDRWLGLDRPMIYAPEAVVLHCHALTLRTFWRQHFNYGAGAAHYHHMRSKRNQDRVRIEPLSFYFRLLRYPFAEFPSWRAAPLAALMVVSQAANALGFFMNRNRRRGKA